MISDILYILGYVGSAALLIFSIVREKELDKREAELEERERKLK